MKKPPVGPAAIATDAIDVMVVWFGGRASAQADLGQNALTGENLSRQADHEAHHGQAAVPGFGEVDETEAGLGSVRHGRNP